NGGERDAVGGPLVAPGRAGKIYRRRVAGNAAENPGRRTVCVLVALVSTNGRKLQFREEIDQRLAAVKAARNALNLRATSRALVQTEKPVLRLDPVRQRGLFLRPVAVLGNHVED